MIYNVVISEENCFLKVQHFDKEGTLKILYTVGGKYVSCVCMIFLLVQFLNTRWFRHFMT